MASKTMLSDLNTQKSNKSCYITQKKHKTFVLYLDLNAIHYVALNVKSHIAF